MNKPAMPASAQLHVRGPEQTELHEQAMALMRKRFGNHVFVRAVVEISNFCRENCSYCGMRRSNRQLKRYRADVEQLAELLIEHRPPSVTDVNIQAGEDPVAVRDIAIPLIRTLKGKTSLGVSVCLGLHDKSVYAEMKEAGASIYILKFETANPAHYAKMEAPATFERRIGDIRHLASTGWNVSSGFIAGLPLQGDAELLENFELASRLPLAGISVSPFIPGDETPLSTAPISDVDLTLNCMAAFRIMRPDWIIPSVSALNLADPGNGYRRGLRAGANLVTINMTPSDLRNDYLLYKRDRFIMTEERILSAIAAEGQVPSSRSLAEFYRTGKVNGYDAPPGVKEQIESSNAGQKSSL